MPGPLFVRGDFAAVKDESSGGGRFCSSCGTEATVGASFCSVCGHELPPVQTTTGWPDALAATMPVEEPVAPSATPDPANPGGPTRRSKKFVVVGLALILVVGLGAAGAVLLRHHRIATASASQAQGGNGDPSIPSTTLSPSDLTQQCANEAASLSSIVWTDSNGNKATGTFCGYTVTGEDAAGNSAPAGESYDNIVISLSDNQSDRAANLEENTVLDLDLELGGASSCSAPANTGSPAGCYPFYSNAGDVAPESLWSYSETGGIAAINGPLVIQPGSPQLFFVSVLAPTNGADPSGVYANYGNVNAGIGPELSTSLFSSP